MGWTEVGGEFKWCIYVLVWELDVYLLGKLEDLVVICHGPYGVLSFLYKFDFFKLIVFNDSDSDSDLSLLM